MVMDFAIVFQIFTIYKIYVMINPVHDLGFENIYLERIFKLKQNYKIDFIVIGFALFAMFFGAGNLIFPPSIGLNAGSSWKEAFLGFFLTEIGLSATVGDYFSKIIRFSYEKLVIGTCIFSAIIASFGVEFIVKFSVPVLLILYPITIILIILHILGINNRKTFKYSIYLSIFISLLQLGVTQFNVISFNKILYMLPFYNSGFPWLMPFTFVLIITNYKYKTK